MFHLLATQSGSPSPSCIACTPLVSSSVLRCRLLVSAGAKKYQKGEQQELVRPEQRSMRNSMHIPFGVGHDGQYVCPAQVVVVQWNQVYLLSSRTGDFYFVSGLLH